MPEEKKKSYAMLILSIIALMLFLWILFGKCQNCEDPKKPPIKAISTVEDDSQDDQLPDDFRDDPPTMIPP